MNLLRTTAMAAFAASTSLSASAAEWKPTSAPLMSRWAGDVSPDNARPEYPRPQMVRKAWQNLNGLWQFAAAKEGEEPPLGRELDGQILVPYPVESALSGVGRHEPRVWYRRTFTVPPGWKNEDQRVLLHFDAVDWETTVWVNGEKLGSHKGGYDPFSFDITDRLKASGSQEVVVGVFDPTSNGKQPHGKQHLEPHGIWYTPTTGIWQTVWLEPVPKSSIERLRMTPDIDAGRLRLTVKGRDAKGAAVRATALDGGREIATATGKADEELTLSIPGPKLWTPDSPHLYDLRVELLEEGRTVDTVDSYFGMRKTSLGKDEKGITRLFLNNRPLFQIGPLDQGFWPDGIHTAPTDEALRWDIEFTKDLGFNMIRKHIKAEPARWYYWADKLGMLVWQDMVSPGVRSLDEFADAKPQFEAELRRMLEERHNSPSIVMWVIWNEAWGQYDTERLTEWVKTQDPSRLVNSVSGWVDKGAGDVIDMHRYPGPGANNPEEDRAAVLGEFGGLGLAVPGHLWQEKTFHYQGTENKEHLTRRYEQLLRRVHQLKEDPGLSAAVYTQTTDVEGENNGLVTYDRKVVKVDPDRVAMANRGELPPIEVTTVVPTAERKALDWKYTFENPGKGWMAPGFDDSGWKEGPAGFGLKGTPGSTVRTDWHTTGIWLRREFEMPDPEKLGDLYLLVHHDDECEVYLNGVLAAREKGYTTNYVDLGISGEARKTLRQGRNTLAVRCRNEGGNQYIDAGIISLRDGKAE